MDFETALKKHMLLHSCAECCDVVKFCYQAAYGGEHLLTDFEAARRFFYEEYESTPAKREEVVEYLSEVMCRVNIAGWKNAGRSADELYDIFIRSIEKYERIYDKMAQYLDTAALLIDKVSDRITASDWSTYVEEYRLNGMPAVHHSHIYNKKYHPAYRVVMIELLPENIALKSHRNDV